MDVTGASVLLLARLLILGPDGTRTLSEHRARIPSGATGLIHETLREGDLPGALAVSVTPQRRPIAGSDDPNQMTLRLTVRVELWRDPAGEAAGRKPDEVNQEEMNLDAGTSKIVQLAEDLRAEKRLVISFRILGPDDETTRSPVVSSHPREVAFRVDAYRETGGVRELLSTHALRTLEDLPVSCQSSWRLGSSGPASVPTQSEEEIALTLRPHTPQKGWISVEASFRARLLPAAGSTSPRVVDSSTTRTVPLGIPFEISWPVGAPSPGDDPNAPERLVAGPPESFVVQITPYLPPISTTPR